MAQQTIMVSEKMNGAAFQITITQSGHSASYFYKRNDGAKRFERLNDDAKPVGVLEFWNPSVFAKQVLRFSDIKAAGTQMWRLQPDAGPGGSLVSSLGGGGFSLAGVASYLPQSSPSNSVSASAHAETTR